LVSNPEMPLTEAQQGAYLLPFVLQNALLRLLLRNSSLGTGWPHPLTHQPFEEATSHVALAAAEQHTTFECHAKFKILRIKDIKAQMLRCIGRS